MTRIARRCALRWLGAAALTLPVGVGGAVLGSCSAPVLAPSFPSPLLGQRSPELGRALDGAPLDSSALRGRIVLIDFFASYCAPCARVLPALQALHLAHPEVAFVGVSLDERRADALSMASRYHLEFPVLLDRSRVVAGRFRVRELPATFLIDATGAVRWVAGPDHTPQDIEQALESLLTSG